MRNTNNKISGLPAIAMVCMALISCEKDKLPLTETLAAADYYGDWRGASVSTRSLTAGAIIETPVALTEIMNLRQENGKDTFNFKDLATGLNIAGRQGTWYITQVNNSDDPALNGAKILKLRVVTSATRITYTTLTIKQIDAKSLVLNDGANKTLTYNK